MQVSLGHELPQPARLVSGGYRRGREAQLHCASPPPPIVHVPVRADREDL